MLRGFESLNGIADDASMKITSWLAWKTLWMLKQKVKFLKYESDPIWIQSNLKEYNWKLIECSSTFCDPFFGWMLEKYVRTSELM